MMRYQAYILLFLLTQISCAQFNPQHQDITKKFFPDHDFVADVTPALMKKKGFTNYEELMQFLNLQKTTHPNDVAISFIGKTQKNLDIPLIRINRPTETNEKKLKVWMLGGLHGNEPASTEGVLYFIHQLLNDKKYAHLLDKIELAIVPMANIDGYLKQNREAANGLDLNRDQTKLMAPESVALKQAFTDYAPDIALDFHEYNPFRKDFSQMSSFGVMNGFDCMFLYTNHPNAPKNTRQLIDTLFVKGAKNTLAKNDLTTYDYITTNKYSGEIHFNIGSINPRSSAASFTLTNTIACLIEVRGVGLGRTSFKRRMNVTSLVAFSFLETAYKNKALIEDNLKNPVFENDFIVIKSKPNIYKRPISFIDLDKKDKIDLNVTLRDNFEATPTLTRKKPDGYVIMPSNENLIERLNILGIQSKFLENDTEITVENYTVDEYERESYDFEGVRMQNVKTTNQTITKMFPKGSILISTDQKHAPLLYELIEPEAVSSFVSFGLLNTTLNDELPIYRFYNQ